MNNVSNFCGEDLFQVIMGMDRVVIDSCAEWKQRSLREPERAFILGRTIDNEADNLEGVFFNKEIKGGRRNVFLLNATPFNGLAVISIDRLDTHFKAIFRGTLPRLGEMSPTERTKWNDPAKRRHLRDSVAQTVATLSSEILRARIKATVPQAFKNFVVSCNIAEWAYSLLIQETSHRDKTELTKFNNNHERLFGDTQLIQEALLLKASILSDNIHVQRMASYCGIKCEKAEKGNR